MTQPSYKYKRIYEYTEEELNQAVNDAVQHCHDANPKLDFYRILNGVDAYMERRKRKHEYEAAEGTDDPPPPITGKADVKIGDFNTN